MRKEKELLLLSHLRSNARESLTRISKKTRIPISTIFDKIRTYEEDIIQKHTSLLDFRKLGFDVKAHVLFRINREHRDDFGRFLLQHPCVNSVFRVNNGFDFIVEVITKTLTELDTFFDETQRYAVEARQEYFVLNDVLREGFLAYRPGFETVIMPQLQTLEKWK